MTNDVKHLSPEHLGLISNICGHILKGWLGEIPTRYSTYIVLEQQYWTTPLKVLKQL